MSTSNTTNTTTTLATADAAPRRARRTSLAVGSLSLGIFTLVTSEFLPASLLPGIAADLGITEGTAGQMVTATAISGIIGGPLIVSTLARTDRRRVMAALTLLAVASNVLVALVPAFPLVLASRLLLGIAISGFWAMSLAVVAAMVPPDRLGRSMTAVNAGVSLATIAAVPAGTYLGEALGWRTAFLVTAGLGVLTLVAQVTTLPSIAPAGSPGLGALLRTARTPALALTIGAITLIAGGHFMSFTYVRPALEVLASDPTPAVTATILVVFGVATFVGNAAAGPLADRHLVLVVLAVPLVLSAGVLAFAALGTGLAMALVAIFVWGVGFGAVPTMVQTWIAHVAPDRLESAGGLIVMAFQVAITIGAAVGGLLVDSVGVQAAFVAGGVAAALGGVVLAGGGRR